MLMCIHPLIPHGLRHLRPGLRACEPSLMYANQPLPGALPRGALVHFGQVYMSHL